MSICRLSMLIHPLYTTQKNIIFMQIIDTHPCQRQKVSENNVLFVWNSNSSGHPDVWPWSSFRRFLARAPTTQLKTNCILFLITKLCLSLSAFNITYLWGCLNFLDKVFVSWYLSLLAPTQTKWRWTPGGKDEGNPDS